MDKMTQMVLAHDRGLRALQFTHALRAEREVTARVRQNLNDRAHYYSELTHVDYMLRHAQDYEQDAWLQDRRATCEEALELLERDSKSLVAQQRKAKSKLYAAEHARSTTELTSALFSMFGWDVNWRDVELRNVMK